MLRHIISIARVKVINSKMAQLAGKYTYEKEENIDSYLKALGLGDEQIKGALAANKQLEIKVDGNNYTLSSALGPRTFPLDQEIDEKLPDGHVLKSTASVSGGKFTIKSTGQDGKKGERVYEVSGNELILTMSTEGAGSGKLVFKRA